MRHFYPTNVNELRETLYKKLEAFNRQVSEYNKHFKNAAFNYFESVCVPTEEFKKKLQLRSEDM